MTGAALLTRAVTKLESHWATRRSAEVVRDPGFDSALAERLCGMLFDKCGRSSTEYDNAVEDLIALSAEFVELQMELDRTGHYKLASYDEARAAVYDNPSVMERRYLNGLFLSTIFWTNHTKMFRYFLHSFCADLSPQGSALEVPSGTGIFISEFARLNRRWRATGIDISDSSVSFSREIARLNGNVSVTISRADVFELPETDKFDRIICGELLEHLERPDSLLEKLTGLLKAQGKLFLTTAIWAANIDHIYLFKSAQEVRDMLTAHARIESELVLNIFDDKAPDDKCTPINYAAILAR